MDTFNCSFSEVSTYHLHSSSKGEISLDIGANQSTLQDFKLAESAGYYCYKDSNVWSSPTCNRFIYWRSKDDYIQFTEISMDFNLAYNHVQLRFQNTPILDGISVHETGNQVIILLATVASIHRITLPHPKRLGTVLVDSSRSGPSNTLSQGSSNINPSDLHTRKSIFYDLNAVNLRDPDSYYVLNNAFNGGSSFSSSEMPFPVRSCSWLNSHKEAHFALADLSGNISVIRMVSSAEGKVIVWDLKNNSLIKSLWYNLVPSVISRGGQENNEQAALSILWHRYPDNDDDLMITLCRDLRIRIWSSSKQECLLIENILDSCQDVSVGYSTSLNRKSVNDPLIVTMPILKKAEPTSATDVLFLAAFVATHSGRKFIIYKLVNLDDHLVMKVVTSFDAPEDDLVDFVFNATTLWGLWLNAKSEVSLSHWEFLRGEKFWQNVSLYNQFQPSINIKSMLVNPKELFIEKIFKKGRFSAQTIAKAISTLNRTHESAYSFLSMEALIDEVTSAVENRIRMRSGIADLSSDVYANLECELWNEFFSYCIQYHNVFNKPLGLFLDSQTGLAGVLRASSVSYLRPNDSVDHVLLSQVHSPNYTIKNTLTRDYKIEASLQVLLQYVKVISNCLNEDILLELEMGFMAGEPIEQVASDIVDKYLVLALNNSEENEQLFSSLDNIHSEAPHLLEAIELLLKSLNLESKERSDEDMETSLSLPQQALDHYLGGNVGACILTESLKQTCRLRYEFCRDLLLFQLLLIRKSSPNRPIFVKLSDLPSNSIAINGLYVQAYFSMTWICETSMSLKDSSFLGIENTVTLLATLELHEYINVNRNPPNSNSLLHDFSPKSIIAHLISHKKCSAARKNLVSNLDKIEDLDSCETWVAIQPFLVQVIAQIIWPISRSSYVLRFLLGYEQFELIDQYSKMLDIWCKYNTFSRRFVMGVTQLFCREPKKSVALFHQALPGLLKESFLQKIFLSCGIGSPEDKKLDRLTNTEITSYFNKLFRLCRLHSQHGIILELAKGAIELLNESESSYEQHYSSFMSTIFMCHLEFSQSAEAYVSMLLNPSPIQRKDCLRQFTVKLYEKQAIAEMINYDYGEMEEDFINILEFRARSTDLLQTEKKVDFYEILYAYFIKGNNYRKSAAIIYEYAKRLCQEVNGVESLKKQAKCLLLAINSLKLVDLKYAWIIRPTIKTVISSSVLPFGKSASSSGSIKRKHGLDDAQDISNVDTMTRKEIQVLNITDIEKEYELINARYKLLEKSPKLNSIAATPLSAEETVTLLIANLLFDLAFHLSSRFELSYEPVLEGLVGKYVYLTELPFRKISLEAGLMEINECFIENDTASLSFIANAEMPAIDKMLFLILAYVEKYEQKNQSQLHKCVAEKLLGSGIPLPAPLKLSYQKRNSPELLRILMSYDYIEDAYNFAIELIDGYLGQGTEYFNIQAPVIGGKQVVYFPHQHIKCLLKILETEKDDHKEYQEFATCLKRKMDKYRELIISCHQITAR